MSWSKEDRESPRGYHHGNLKEALLRAALELIAQKGPAGFTFAEAARWAGVSPAAPYRHFRDRDELLAQHRASRLPTIRNGIGEGMGRWPPRCLHRVRPPRKDLSAIRANRARLLFGDVRSRHSACYQPGTARRRRSRLRGLARGGGKAMCAGANARAGRRCSWSRCIFGRWRMASLRCSGVGMRRGGRCRCRRKNFWRPRR